MEGNRSFFRGLSFRAPLFLEVFLLFSGCAHLQSSGSPTVSETGVTLSNQAKGGGGSRQALEPQKDDVVNLKAENEKTKKQIAWLITELISTREMLNTAQRQIEILGRGVRSGLFEDFSGKKVVQLRPPSDLGFEEMLQDRKIDLPSVTREQSGAPDLSLGRTSTDETSVGAMASSSGGGPAQVLADAELRMRRGQYGEAVVIIGELRDKFPNHPDGGNALLMLAECWLHLGEFANVLPPLRTFYLNHPSGPDLLRAKSMEAEAQEKMGARDKAAMLYRDVISAGPETKYAELSRAALERMRDMK